MKYSTLVKASLAVAVGFVVTAASAAIFEDSFSTPTYALGDSPTNGCWTAATGDDLSVVTNAPDIAQGQYLNLNTDGDTLTSKMSAQDVSDLNDALNNQGGKAGVQLDSLIKFVPSDEANAVQFAANDNLKFALYAFGDEDNGCTNLVIAHAYCDSDANYIQTNNVTSVAIDADVMTHVEVTTKKFTGSGYGTLATPTAFQVKINDVVVTNAYAYTEDALATAYAGQNTADGTWFLIASIEDEGGNTAINSIQLKGTGAVDEISLDAITPAAVDPDVAYVAGTGYTTNDMANAYAAAANASIQFVLPWTLTGDPSTNDFSAGLTFNGGVLTVGASATLKVPANYLSQDFDEAYTDLNTFIADELTYAILGENGATILIGEDKWTYNGTEWVKYVPPAPQDEWKDSANDDIPANIVAWLQENSVSAATAKGFTNAALAKANLLNLDLNAIAEDEVLVDAAYTFKVSSITVGNQVVVTVQLVRGTEDKYANGAINGQLQLKGAATLDQAQWSSADTPVDGAFAEGATTATFDFEAGENKFFKAEIVPANAE